MKKKKMLLVLISLIIALCCLSALYNFFFGLVLNKSYKALNGHFRTESFAVDQVPFTGRLVFEHTDSSANYVSSIYLDTLNLTFKIVLKNYTGHADNEETSFLTFNAKGKILSVEKFVPVETDDQYRINQLSYDERGVLIGTKSDVKLISAALLTNSVLLPGVLKPWPSWKNRSSPVFVRHFVKKKINLSQLNPFRIGGINGNRKVSIWEGTAYCDLKFDNYNLKLKLPFGYDALLFNYADYYSELQYYKMPAGFEKDLQIRIIQLDDKIYVVRRI